MSFKIEEMKKQMKAAKDKAASILQPAMNANRSMNEQENKDYSACEVEVKALSETIARAEQVNSWENETVKSDAVRPVVNHNQSEKYSIEQKEAAFTAYLRAKGNLHNMSSEMLAVLNETTPGDGGYTVPTILNNKVIEKKLLANVMRTLPGVNLITTASTENYPVEGNPAVCEWTGENTDFQEASPTFGTKQIAAYKLTTYVKVADELLEDTSINMPDYVAKAIAKAVGQKEENAILYGLGSTQPTGLLTGSEFGTGNTTASATAITADELLIWFYSLNRQYRQGSVIVASDSFELAVRKIKDSTTNAYLWQAAVLADVPSTLMGRPLVISSQFNALAVSSPPATQPGAVIFDPSYLTIADRGVASFVRDDSIFRLKGLVAFVYKSRMDAKVTLAEAGKKLIMHS